ncbi:porin family protein [Bradyrhizobium sediminis]|uniref:Porin family protein n=2 Tax=Bradyrhizobium sediminis TaxID=2840469 RepID=A0A975NTZ3_9BRAD|nr:porin family protein [Bradyrhizobium sediminis]
MAAIPAASAADLAPRYTKAPPVMVEVWNWTGFYIGGNAGYSWGRSNSDVSYFNTATGLPIVPPAGSITSAAFDMNGGIAGGQAGYNWQTGSWVWGVEADIQWSGEKGSSRFLCAPLAQLGGACLPGLTALIPGVTGTSLALDQSLEWFGTARLRGGFLVSPRVLLYGTGGLAYGSIKTSGTLSGFTPGDVPVSISGSSTETHLGWTVGAGIEGKITQNWSAKLEYLYMDLGRYDSLTLSLAPASLIGAHVSSHFTDHILRAGINYQFGGPVVAKY